MALVIAVERRKVGDLGGRDHHATGVFTGVAHYPFQAAGHVDEVFDLLILLVELGQLGLGLERLGQRHAGIRRNELGDAIDKTVGVTQHPAHVPHHRLGRHAAEGDDLRHRLPAIHVGNVLDHLVAPIHAEVDVEVGHGYPLGVEETFEQQVKFQRVEVGDLEGVGHQRACTRATARANGDAVVLGPLDKLHHDEEVTREAHLVDHFQLDIETLVILGTALGPHRRIREQELETLLQTLFRFGHQKIFGSHVASREVGQEVLAETHRHVAALGDLHRVFQRFGNVGKQLGHLLLTAQVLLGAVATGTAFVHQGIAIVDGDPDLVGVEVIGVEEHHLVGGHYRQLELGGNGHRHMQIDLLVGATGAQQLEVIGIREVGLIEGDALLGHLAVALEQELAHIPLAPAGEDDHPLGVFGKPGLVDDRTPLHMAALITAGDEQGDVLVALVVHGKQGEAELLVAKLVTLHPEVGTDDGFDPLAVGGAIEAHQTAHVHLIGQRQRRHVVGRRRPDDGVDLLQAIDHGEVGVDSQVDKTGVSHRHLLSLLKLNGMVYSIPSARRTGLKLLRYSGNGPRSARMARCSAVG